MTNKRIMGIDYGDVRTGIALSDIMGMMASGLTTVRAYTDEKLIPEILKLINDNNVGFLVIGYPVNMNGSIGPRAEKIESFARKLKEASGLEYELIDERCSTMMAHGILNVTNTKGKKRKEVVDTLSAEIILQSYLDRKASSR